MNRPDTPNGAHSREGDEADQSPTEEQHDTRGHVADQMEENADAADVALAAADELAEVRAELDDQRNRIHDLEDQVRRRAAEFQNYRRRTQTDLSQASERGRAEVITRLLDVLDDLHRSRQAAEQAAENEEGGPLYDALKQGVDLVSRKFEDALAALGVETIEAEGQPFDENLHEAIGRQEVEDAEPGTVLTEVQRGYTLGDRVLRHARVIVAG